MRVYYAPFVRLGYIKEFYFCYESVSEISRFLCSDHSKNQDDIQDSMYVILMLNMYM